MSNCNEQKKKELLNKLRVKGRKISKRIFQCIENILNSYLIISIENYKKKDVMILLPSRKNF